VAIGSGGVGGIGVAPAGELTPTRYRVAGEPGLTLTFFDVGLACCAVEFAAATMAHPDLLPIDAEGPGAGPEVMVVSGTVTDKMAPAVLAYYEQLPRPRHVLSFGACASSGGPYWDSYSVTKGVDQMLPVDVYVPGCPPRPEALLQGLAAVRARMGPS
jgi:NADH-quinone oxidoreductase subunit B